MTDGYAVVRVLVNPVTGDVKVENTGLLYEDSGQADYFCSVENAKLEHGYYTTIALFKAKENK